MSTKYFKTIYTIIVLSEDEPLGPVDLSVIDHQITNGECIGQTEETEVEELSADEMRTALKEVGNDGSFFSSLNEEDEEESETPTALEKGPGDEDENEDADPDADLKWDPDADDDELFGEDADGDEDITED